MAFTSVRSPSRGDKCGARDCSLRPSDQGREGFTGANRTQVQGYLDFRLGPVGAEEGADARSASRSAGRRDDEGFVQKPPCHFGRNSSRRRLADLGAVHLRLSEICVDTTGRVRLRAEASLAAATTGQLFALVGLYAGEDDATRVRWQRCPVSGQLRGDRPSKERRQLADRMQVRVG